MVRKEKLPMKKLILSLLGFVLLATASFAQKADAVHKAITHPARQLESGKADVYIQDKEIITADEPKAATKAKRKKKSASCGKRTVAKKD